MTAEPYDVYVRVTKIIKKNRLLTVIIRFWLNKDKYNENIRNQIFILEFVVISFFKQFPFFLFNFTLFQESWRDKTIDDKVVYIPKDELSRFKILIDKFEDY